LCIDAPTSVEFTGNLLVTIVADVGPLVNLQLLSRLSDLCLLAMLWCSLLTVSGVLHFRVFSGHFVEGIQTASQRAETHRAPPLNEATIEDLRLTTSKRAEVAFCPHKFPGIERAIESDDVMDASCEMFDSPKSVSSNVDYYWLLVPARLSRRRCGWSQRRCQSSAREEWTTALEHYATRGKSR